MPSTASKILFPPQPSNCVVKRTQKYRSVVYNANDVHYMYPVNTKHLYNIYAILDQPRRQLGRRCVNVIQISCACWVHDTSTQCLTNVDPPSTLAQHWSNIG